MRTRAIVRNYYCWGNAFGGKLGIGMNVNHVSTPMHVELSNVKQVACGAHHSLFLSNNQVLSTGSNFYGQCGYVSQVGGILDDDDDEILLLPSRIDILDMKITQIASGDFHSVALCDKSSIWTWGSGILGHANEFYDSRPHMVSLFSDINRKATSISAKSYMTMCIASPYLNLKASEVYIWGYYRTNDGEWRKSLSPVLVQHAFRLENVDIIRCGIDGTFGILGTADDHTILQIYGKSAFKKFDVPGNPKIMDAENIYDIYACPPLLNFDLTYKSDISDFQLGNGICLVLYNDGHIKVLDLVEGGISESPWPLDSKAVAISVSSKIITITTSKSIYKWETPADIISPISFSFRYFFPGYKKEDTKLEYIPLKEIFQNKPEITEFNLGDSHKLATGHDHFISYN